ncbi:MAG: HAD-IA family hydrolase [Acutalibacteraceae bacterium]
MGREYRTLFFDLDDTLFDYTGDEKRCIEKVLHAHGVTPDFDIFEKYYSLDDWQIFKLGSINPKTIISGRFARMLQIMNINDHASQMIDEFYEGMIASHSLKDFAIKLLEYLVKKHYKLYITANGYSDIQRKRIKDAKIEKYFNGIFISEEMNIRKPCKAFFDYIINRIPESNLKHILLIGDAPTADILGGINAKIDTAWLNNGICSCKYKYTYELKNLKELTSIL